MEGDTDPDTTAKKPLKSDLDDEGRQEKALEVKDDEGQMKDDKDEAHVVDNLEEDEIEDFESVLEAGSNALKKEDYAAAVLHFKRLTQNPNTPPDLVNTARCNLVLALYKDDRHEEAEKVTREVMPSPSVRPKKVGDMTDEEANNADDKSSTETIGSSHNMAALHRALLVTGSNSVNGTAAEESEMPSPSSVNSTRPKKQQVRKRDRKKSSSSSSQQTNGTKSPQQSWMCTYCQVTLFQKSDFEAHCRSETHQQIIMSDEGRTWKFRAPPRGVGSDDYSICTSIVTDGSCRLGDQCSEAHSNDELKEWRERFEYRQKRAQKATKLFGKSFVDSVVEKWSSAQKGQGQVLANSLESVETSYDRDLTTKVVSKQSKVTWTFLLKSKPPTLTTTASKSGHHQPNNRGQLRNIGLLNDANRGHFRIEEVKQIEIVAGRRRNRGKSTSNSISGIEAVEEKEEKEKEKENEEEVKKEPTPTEVLFYKLSSSDSTQEGADDVEDDEGEDEGTSNGLQEWSFTQAEKSKLTSTLNSTSSPTSNVSPNPPFTYSVTVSFKTDIFGTFRQSVVFNFGSEPYLKQDLCVEVTPEEEKKREKEEESEDDEELLRKFQEKIIEQPERWEASNTTIKDFDPPIAIQDAEDEILLKSYPLPQPAKFSPQAIKEPMLTKSNYKRRMHELLFIEEMAQFEQLAAFNVITRLELKKTYLLMPTSSNSSTAKYARGDELFGMMTLGANLSEDTPAGRLILSNCQTLLLTKAKDKEDDSEENEKRVAYTSEIEDTGKDTLYLRLSPKMVEDYDLKADKEVDVEVQFQLNRLPLCEMHLAVDKLPDLALVYPDVKDNKAATIPWSPVKQWSNEMDSQLNPKQREAILAITTQLDIQIPPVLLIGPYGTGKTFTLGQAIKMLLKPETEEEDGKPEVKRRKKNRILVCTHSNSAADLYIRDYLDPHIEKQATDARPKLVRVYYRHRWVQTVHQTVQKYCLITQLDSQRVFRNPHLRDVEESDIVVATLSTCKALLNLGLPQGFFSHILVDEAAQAMECEALMPLALAGPHTRVVLAGDHMQLSPEVFSTFANKKSFNKSLLERLYDHYPVNFSCKILLCENYRSHAAIIEYTSALFYEQKLVASGKQLAHDTWHPLSVFTARGEDVQDENSTSFYNNAEVYEVVERVAELQRTWPKSWGHRDEHGIGIVTPYYDQVQRIRSELRKRRLYGVSVERVLNVQGKQFRAIFLSTVRTRTSCIKAADDPDDCEFGFLSNAKLLNTAITRAQSLVAVVGDPLALSSMGRCRKLWERFIESAAKNKSLIGMRWMELRGMLDRVELKKSYVLNPYAKEFVPRASTRRAPREAFLHSLVPPPIPHTAASLPLHLPTTLPPPTIPPPPPIGGTGPPHLPPFTHYAAAAAAASAIANHHHSQFPPFLPGGMAGYGGRGYPHQSAHPGSYSNNTAAYHAALLTGKIPPPLPPPIPGQPPPNMFASHPPPPTPPGAPPAFQALRQHQHQQQQQAAILASLANVKMPPPPVPPHIHSSPPPVVQSAPPFAAPPMNPALYSSILTATQQAAAVTAAANAAALAHAHSRMPPSPKRTVPPPSLAAPNSMQQQRMPSMFANSTYQRPRAQDPVDHGEQKEENNSSFAFIDKPIHYPSQSTTATQQPLKTPAGNATFEQVVSIVESGVMLFPGDCSARSILNSGIMTEVWSNNLNKTHGEQTARKFLEVAAFLKENPQFIDVVDEQRAQLPKMTPQQSRPQEQQQLERRQQQQPLHTLPGVQASDLETALLQESQLRQSQELSSMLGATGGAAASNPAENSNSANDALLDSEISKLLKTDSFFNNILGSEEISQLGQRIDEEAKESAAAESEEQQSGYVPLYMRRADAAAASGSAFSAPMPTRTEPQRFPSQLQPVSNNNDANAAGGSILNLESSSIIFPRQQQQQTAAPAQPSLLTRMNQQHQHRDDQHQAQSVTSRLASLDLDRSFSQQPQQQQVQQYSAAVGAVGQPVQEQGAATQPSGASGSSSLTYANVVRSDDPLLTKIRNLGTEGNRDVDHSNFYDPFRGWGS